MERIKSLDIYQKGVLILMTIMTLVFAVVYFTIISKVGFEYKGEILTIGKENDSTVYFGEIQGQQAKFTVSEDKTIVFQYGDKNYGPYKAKEDPTAIPKDEEMQEYMTGVELYQGDDVIFRGGVLEMEDSYWLYDEGGIIESFGFSYIPDDGFERDETGDIIDSMEPSASTILTLMNDPEVTHKGEWTAWFGAVFVCVLNTLSILFTDELFRWHLVFRIRNVDNAEPSDWEIASRYISWTVLAIAALVIFVMGLQ